LASYGDDDAIENEGRAEKNVACLSCTTSFGAFASLYIFVLFDRILKFIFYLACNRHANNSRWRALEWQVEKDCMGNVPRFGLI